MAYLRVCNKSNTTGAHVKQELPTLPEHLGSLGCKWGSCYSIFSFLCNVLYIVACPFVLFLLAIVLSVLLRITASD